ncbi:SMC family ATPase [Acidaminobacter sp. JC074]|uniref:SMC family ATPase n=1 Tax=Acidaminobacter sp. JC074 TaxID=2530199 RepID=UPI001F0E695B|nr:SMC family ATPase [Acidaminobacter sp. JC074]
MKPIKLTMKGLNSFLESQTIDFEALTQYGLFGVFGPTGSGKSSILDGMTLALYGENSRNSSNYINVQTDRMQIEFEFEVDKVSYKVIRTFKRTPQGSINSAKPMKLESFVHGEWVILEEQKKLIDNKIYEIIGLEFKDFIRTVVLPQGKFSEFIQLKNQPRRDMLERLFDLSKYGNDLSDKLKAAKRKEEDKALTIAGELKGYEDVTPSRKKELEDKLKEVKEQYEKDHKQVITLRDQLKSLEKTYNLSQELEASEKLHQELLNQAEDMKLKEKQMLEGQKILRVVPYYDQMRDSKKKLDQVIMDYDQALTSYQVLDQRLESDQKLYDKSSQDYHNFMNLFEVKRSNFEKLIKDKDMLLNKEARLKEEEKVLNKSGLEEAETTSSIEKKNQESHDIEEHIQSLEKDMADKVVSAEKQAFIDKGYELEKSIEKLTKDQISFEASIEKLAISKHRLELDALEKELKTSKEKVTDLLEDEAYTLKKQDLLRKEEIYTKSKKDLEDNQKSIDLIKASLDENNTAIEKHQLVLQDYLSRKEDNLLQTIKSTLKSGDDCPICGHEITQITSKERDFVEDESIEETMKSLKVEEETLKHQLNQLDDEKNRLHETFESVKDFDVKAIETLDIKYQEDKNHANALQRLGLDVEKKRDFVTLLVQQEESEVKRLEEVKDSLGELKDQYGLLKSDYPDTSFEVLKADLYEKSKDYQTLKTEVDKKRDLLKLVQKDLDTKKITLEDARKTMALKSQAISSLKGDIEALSKMVDTQIDYESNLTKLLNEKKQLEIKHDADQAAYKKLKDSHQEALLLYNELKTLKSTSESAYSKAESTLNQKLSQEVLLLDLLKKHTWTVEKLDQLRVTLEDYHKEVHRLTLAVQNFKDLLGDEKVTQEALEFHKKVLVESEANFETVKEARIKIERDLESLKTKFDEMKDLLEKQAAIDYQLSLLNDLQTLFRGKRFVEFVAAYQLRYISIEASKRLFDITSGKYGLEVDDHGQFLIRDYSHGGQIRDTSTLSGGESFLVSLSLALSLSSQIQLKGKAPLELFFLDEGFGTLDDRFLELVMSSLEKIHHDKLSIGLISHVESIKNRVPIKLNVTPSVSGVKGSRVKIEKS